MQSYKPKYKPNQLILGTNSDLLILTGWLPKEYLAKQLEPDMYAAIGNLYSPTRGISFFLRNLLLNPQIETIVLISSTKEDTNTGSIQCLCDFFDLGFEEGLNDLEKPCWLPLSQVRGCIDIEIDRQALESLRSLNVYLYKNKDNAIEAIKQFKYWDNPSIPRRDKKEFPILEATPTAYPGELYGHRIEGKTIAETWVKVIHRIKTFGVIRPTGYDGYWQELIDLIAVVTDEPLDFFFTDYLPANESFIKSYLPYMLADGSKEAGVKYTYGQRLRSWFGCDQIEQVINKLVNEVDAASAVMTLWDVKDHERGGSPCLNHIWLRVVNNELSMTATFRSNDMFSAWVSNAMGLRALQEHIRMRICNRSSLELKLGRLITISQSAHIYSDCWEHADMLIKKEYKKDVNFSDPVGNFLIDIEGDKIKLTHTTLGSGVVIDCRESKSAKKLLDVLALAFPSIQASHIGYLGFELAKAEYCIQNKLNYTQG